MPRTIQVTQFKATLSEQLARVKAGEEIVVTERGRPVARVVPFRGTGWAGHWERLSALGIARMPSRNPARSWRRRPPVKDRGGAALSALLEGRAEDR